MGCTCNDEAKKYPVRNRNGVRSSSQRDLLAPISNYKKTNQAPTAIDKKKKNYFNWPEPKGWINSVKANSIKVDSTVPGVKYYGDDTYEEYQMVDPHKQPQYENTYMSPGSYQLKGNGMVLLIKDIIVGMV